MSLTERQIEAYSRQIILRDFSGAAQEKLIASSVAIAGSDLAAETAATYLAGAGIGTLQIDPEMPRVGVFADLAQRSEDTRLIEPMPSQLTEVVIQTTAAQIVQPAKYGVVLLEQNQHGDTHLFQFPNASGVQACPQCIPRQGFPGTIDPAAAAIAGSLAALTAIRWIVEPPIAEAPARQSLHRGESIFSRAPVEPNPHCSGHDHCSIS